MRRTLVTLFVVLVFTASKLDEAVRVPQTQRLPVPPLVGAQDVPCVACDFLRVGAEAPQDQRLLVLGERQADEQRGLATPCGPAIQQLVRLTVKCVCLRPRVGHPYRRWLRLVLQHQALDFDALLHVDLPQRTLDFPKQAAVAAGLAKLVE